MQCKPGLWESPCVRSVWQRGVHEILLGKSKRIQDIGEGILQMSFMARLFPFSSALLGWVASGGPFGYLGDPMGEILEKLGSLTRIGPLL